MLGDSSPVYQPSGPSSPAPSGTHPATGYTGHDYYQAQAEYSDYGGYLPPFQAEQDR